MIASVVLETTHESFIFCYHQVHITNSSTHEDDEIASCLREEYIQSTANCKVNDNGRNSSNQDAQSTQFEGEIA